MARVPAPRPTRPTTAVPLAGLVNGAGGGCRRQSARANGAGGRRGAREPTKTAIRLPAPGRGAAAAAGRGTVFGQTVMGTVPNYVDVTDEMLTHPSDGDWLMARRNYQGWSYSPLSQITPANVKSLQLKWTWNMNEGGASQPTPIVHNGIMFLANAHNIIQALDAKTGKLIWENRIGPDVSRAYYGNRSIGLWHDKVYTATSDAHLVALDARTGKTGVEIRNRSGAQGRNRRRHRHQGQGAGRADGLRQLLDRSLLHQRV